MTYTSMRVRFVHIEYVLIITDLPVFVKLLFQIFLFFFCQIATLALTAILAYAILYKKSKIYVEHICQ